MPAAWCLDFAFDIIRQWNLLPHLANTSSWVPNIPAANLVEIGAFRFEASWHPFLQSWKDFRMTVLEAVKRQLEAYGDKWQSRFSSSGKRSAATHCRWLVYRQIAGKSVDDIAALFKAASSASVSEATSILAGQLGLALRSQPRGRPRKAKRASK